MVISLLLIYFEADLITIVNIDLNFFSHVSLCELIELIGYSALISHFFVFPEVDAVGVVDHFGFFVQLFVVADQG